MRTLSLVLGLGLLALCCAFPYDSGSEEHGQYKGPKGTNCTCGWTNKAKRRIVNGRETYVNEYPWMVALAKEALPGRFSLFCGASILTRHHAITAAHCTDGVPASTMAIIAGDHDVTSAYETEHTKMYRIVRKEEHSSYNAKTYVYDIALLITDEPIAFTEAVGPACLPSRPINLANQRVKVTGWGAMQFQGASSTKLLKVNLDVIDLRTCATRYMNIDPTRPTQFCTYTHTKDSCQGDSGGPVTWLDPETNRYTLVGLVSYGKGCATPNYPGVNTDVAAFMPWIQSKIASSHPSRLSTCAKVG